MTVTDPLRPAPRIGSLFTGAGMLDEGVRATIGGTVAWHSETDPAASRVLAHRYPDVPNLGDITAVDWDRVEPVDVLTGGFPCQDVSHAGRRQGLQRHLNRSGLWGAMAQAVDQLRPALVVAENVRGLLSAEADSDVEPCPWCVGDGPAGGMRALGAVLADLADLGYDARWHGLRAADVGAPHGRFRVFIVAWPASDAEHAEWARIWSLPRRRRRLDRATAQHTAGSGLQGITGGRLQPGVSSAGRADAAADAEGDGRDERRTEPTRLVGGPDAPLSGATAPDTHGAGGETLSGRPRTGNVGRLQPMVSSGAARRDLASDADVTGLEGHGRLHPTPRENETAAQHRGAGGSSSGGRGLVEIDQLDAVGGGGVGDGVGVGSPVARNQVSADSSESVPDCSLNIDQRAVSDSSGEHSESSHASDSPSRHQEVNTPAERVSWGPYEPAIRRWELVLGRPAPAPTELAPKGGQRLSPRFVEWMLGWSEGWVTDVPGITRNDQLKICGNGVVPQQAATALTVLLGVEAGAA